MRIAAAAALLAMLFSVQTVDAHEVAETQYDRRPIISDLNALAEYLSREELSNADVIIIAGVTCSTMRVTIRERFVERAAALLNERYPPEDEIAAISISDFISFEEQAFSKLGASPQAVKLVARTIEQNPSIPTISPAQTNSLIEEVQTIEAIACELRTEALGEPAAPASLDAAWLARSLGMGAIGIAVIVVDAKVMLETAGMAAALFGIASGGWGWNRVEEAYSVIGEIWHSVFR